jgi:hypothetical protein
MPQGLPVTIVNDAAGPVVTQSATSGTGTTSSVASSATSVPLLAANASRKGGQIANDSTAILYILFGAGTASTTNYSVAIDAKGTVPGVAAIPAGYTGVVNGIWASANGFARVTEYT